MRLENGHGGEPSAIRDPRFAGASVIVRHVLEQPVDGVVRVRAFVDGFRIFAIARRPLHHELAFGTIFPANILKHENVAVGKHLLVKAEQSGETLSVVAEAVRRARKKKRQRGLSITWSVFRHVDFSVQLDAVAHRNHRVGLGKDRTEVRRPGVFLRPQSNRSKHGGSCSESSKHQHFANNHSFHERLLSVFVRIDLVFSEPANRATETLCGGAACCASMVRRRAYRPPAPVQPGPRNARPEFTPVSLPWSYASLPFTKTKSTPSESLVDSVYVARSMIVAGSKMVTSAKKPILSKPRSVRCSRCAGIEVILRMACSSGMSFWSRTYLPRKRGIEPNVRGCVCSSYSGPSSEAAPASSPIEVQGCFKPVIRSCSLAMKYNAPVWPLSAMTKSISASSSDLPCAFATSATVLPLNFFSSGFSTPESSTPAPPPQSANRFSHSLWSTAISVLMRARIFGSLMRSSSLAMPPSATQGGSEEARAVPPAI